MAEEGGWSLVQIQSAADFIPQEFTEEGLVDLDGSVNLFGAIGRPLGIVEDDVCLVETLDGVLAKIPFADLEEYAPKPGEKGGFDCVWPLGDVTDNPDGWQVFSQDVCEAVGWKGFCVVQLFTSPEERRNIRKPIATFPPENWRRLPADVEEVYLGRTALDKMCWLPLDSYDQEPEDALQRSDRSLTQLAAALAPLTQGYFNFTGLGRTGTMVRVPVNGTNEMSSLQRFMKELNYMDMVGNGYSLTPKVEGYLSFVQLRRLCMIHFAAGSGGSLKLHPKPGKSWLEEVDIPCQENRLVIFRHDLMSYTYAPTGDSVALQTWMLSQSHADLESGLVESGLTKLDFEAPVYGKSGRTVGVMAVHCNLPGNSQCIEDNWCMFTSGTDVTLMVETANRWEHEMYYESDSSKAMGKMYCKHGGFLIDDQMYEFDDKFFGYSPEEVHFIDPGHRKALEVGYGTFYRSGFAKKTLRGKHIGVFIGNSGSDWYTEPLACYAGNENVCSNATTACLSNRICHRFGMKGPCQVNDTACSSSLVALNVGFWDLRPEEPGQLRTSQGQRLQWMLCLGVNALLGPFSWIGLCGPKMISFRGRCFTFDHSADGFNRAEGFTGVTMKDHKECENFSDKLAMVCGGCVNQDGKSASMTAPHGPSQQECIRNSLRESNLTPADIRIAELHGTGTALGDPIEVGALRGVMRKRDVPIYKTSGKSNYGHLEATAGVSGFTKCVMMLSSGFCSPNCHLHTLNANMDTSQYPVIFTDLVTYAGNSGFAGVSSFGFGGTNGRADLWGRALFGPYNTGGQWRDLDKFAYTTARKQDFIDRAAALEDPDFSDSFKEKLQVTLRANYCRHEADVIGEDFRMMVTDDFGKPIPQEAPPLPIGPGTNKALKNTEEEQQFTLQQAKEMQRELCVGYENPEWQEALKSAFTAAGDDKALQSKAIKECTFRVQAEVIEKYGFETTPRGVMESTIAFVPYNSDPEVAYLNWKMQYLISPKLQEASTLDEYIEKMRNPPAGADTPAESQAASEGGFTLEQAKSMQRDLIAGYINPTWREPFKKAMEAAPNRGAQLKIRKDSLWEIQSEVLPKYGFAASQEGLQASLQAFTPHNTDGQIYTMNMAMQYLIDPLQKQSLNDYLATVGISPSPEVDAFLSELFVKDGQRPDFLKAPFTLEQARLMEKELVAGYSDPKWSESLKSAWKAAPNRGAQAKVRKEATLEVQSKILPKYGFAPTPEGIQESLKAFTPYNEDREVAVMNAVMSYLINPALHESSLKDYIASIGMTSSADFDIDAYIADLFNKGGDGQDAE